MGAGCSSSGAGEPAVKPNGFGSVLPSSASPPHPQLIRNQKTNSKKSQNSWDAARCHICETRTTCDKMRCIGCKKSSASQSNGLLFQGVLCVCAFSPSSSLLLLLLLLCQNTHSSQKSLKVNLFIIFYIVSLTDTPRRSWTKKNVDAFGTSQKRIA